MKRRGRGHSEERVAPGPKDDIGLFGGLPSPEPSRRMHVELAVTKAQVCSRMIVSDDVRHEHDGKAYLDQGS